MARGTDDPRAIGTLVVTGSDVVAAIEAGRRGGRPVVLRVTPPFSGRMRARIHVATGADDRESPSPVHVDPERLLADDAPPYPRPADTEDELRADPSVEYTVARQHRRHRSAVERWRETVPDHVVEETSIEADGATWRVDVAVLD